MKNTLETAKTLGSSSQAASARRVPVKEKPPSQTDQVGIRPNARVFLYFAIVVVTVLLSFWFLCKLSSSGFMSMCTYKFVNYCFFTVIVFWTSNELVLNAGECPPTLQSIALNYAPQLLGKVTPTFSPSVNAAFVRSFARPSRLDPTRIGGGSWVTCCCKTVHTLVRRIAILAESVQLCPMTSENSSSQIFLNCHPIVLSSHRLDG